MSVGSVPALRTQLATYLDVRRLDAAANLAKAATDASQPFIFARSELATIHARDGEQTWGHRWLESYKTVLIQRAQSLQKRLNLLYSLQLERALFRPIIGDPNYNMAHLSRMDSRDQPVEGVSGPDSSLFSMYEPFEGGIRPRILQDPSSLAYGMPPQPDLMTALTQGVDTSSLQRDDWGDWISRQYDNPEGPYGLANPLDFFGTGLPPIGAIPIGPWMWFDLVGFASNFLKPLFYPLIVHRYETFAHAEGGYGAIDAAAVRADYQFTAKGLTQFPVIGPALGAAMGIAGPTAIATGGTLLNMVAWLFGTTPLDVPQLVAESFTSALSTFLHPQPVAVAPQTIETPTGAFFATTNVLQDWGMQELEYQYFSAARYQQDFIDTDFLATLRKVGTALTDMLIHGAATVYLGGGVVDPLSLPPLSLVIGPLLQYIEDNFVELVLQPLRQVIEVDPRHTWPNSEVVQSAGVGTAHIGDTPGLAGGLILEATEPGGFAAGYGLDLQATNLSAINTVEILTKRHVIQNAWDGRGIADPTTALERTTYESVSSRLTGVGYNGNPPIDLSQFRTNTREGVITGSGLGAYDRERHDFALSAKTLAGDSIDVGTRVLNPGFGGVTLTTLDTRREDTFYYGSIARAPLHGDFGRIYFAGAAPAGATALISPDSGLVAAQAGSVTFAGPGASGYRFAALPTDAQGHAGLQVTYLGKDGLSPSLRPQNLVDVRDAGLYRVTDLNGQPITAEILSRTAPMTVTAQLPPDWTGSTTPVPLAKAPPGAIHLGLSARVEGVPAQPVRPGRDTDSGSRNVSQLVFLDAAAIARLGSNPPLLTEGSPASGGDYQRTGHAGVNLANLADPANPWTPWQFVAASGKDYDGNGILSPGSIATGGDVQAIEGPDAAKEATRQWFDLIETYVPRSYYRVEPLLTGNDQTPAVLGGPKPYKAEDWNRRFVPDVKWTGQTTLTDSNGAVTGVQDVWDYNPVAAYSAANPPPATAVNPYFWQDPTTGYQYLSIWEGSRVVDGPLQGNPDPNGTPPAQLRAVLRFKPGSSTIEVISDGSAVLLHRGTAIAEIPNDLPAATPLPPPSATSPSLTQRLFADLLARGYTQGRSANDPDPSGQSLYALSGNPAPMPPAGTPGDFTIIGRSGDKLLIAFTKPYDGLVQVPPSTDASGAPVSSWEQVNGWHASGFIDYSAGANWSGSPAINLAPGSAEGDFIWAAPIGGGQAGTDWQQRPDVISLSKTVRLDPPPGDSGLSGDVLPGTFIDLSVLGANAGPYTTDYEPVSGVRYGGLTLTVHNAASFRPDRFTLTVTNAKGTFEVPLLHRTATGELEPILPGDDETGHGTFHIPSEYLAAGENTFTVTVTKGGIYQRYARSEPPADQTSTASQLAAGFWVNTVPVTDMTGTEWPPGNLFYENRMVGDGSGRYLVPSDTDVIHYDHNPLGPGWGGIQTLTPIEVGDLDWHPDSYLPHRSFLGNVFPPTPPRQGGYQLKSDIRHGVIISNANLHEPVQTYGTETVDRYTYDPYTQQVLDVVPNAAHLTAATGPYWKDGPVGLVQPPPLLAPSDGRTVRHWDGTTYVTDAARSTGTNALGYLPIGQEIDPTGKQTFGSDENQLLRYLYASMKIIDVPGEGGDARLYREYRDCFNMGYLDHLYVTGSAESPLGGGITSSVAIDWQRDDDSNRMNDYLTNFEFFASDADRRARRYTTVRRATVTMLSYHAARET